MNDRKALTSGIWYTVSNFVVKSIGFITTPIFTRLLTKEEFGIFNNYSSWLVIITIFVTLNLESTLISARYDYSEKFDEYILSLLSLSTASTLIWLVVINVFYTFFNNMTGLSRGYLNAMILYLLFLPAINLFQARERYLFEYKKTVLISCLVTVGTTLLSVVLVYQMQDRLTGRIVGSIMPSMLVGIVLYIFFLKKGKRIRTIYWKYALIICLPYIPHLLSNNLLNSMDRVMIEKICGSEYTALYSLAYTCGSLITLLVISINSAYAPWLASKLQMRKYSEIRKYSKKYIFIFMIFSVGIMLISPEVLYIMGGTAYLEAKYVMPPVAMGCICQFLYTMFVNVEQYQKKTIGMACATVSAAVINYVLNLIFIPKIGYIAAAYTTLLGYMFLLFMHMLLVFKLGYSCIYEYKFVFGCIFCGILITILVTFLYDVLIIRYFIICVYAFVITLWIFKHRIFLLNFLKKGG